jgi:methanethiol S-methyltransferase
MARTSFKRRCTRVVPAAVERSTYLLATSVVLGMLLWQWRPMPASVWHVHPGWARGLLWALYAVGWLVAVGSTFLVGHLDMFGLRQVLAGVRGAAYTEPGFRQPFLYRFVRHPMMVGLFIAFWATPDMSVGHLLYAGIFSGYILVGVRFEERDLRRQLGEPYQRYAQRVPRFIPRSDAALRRPATRASGAH